MEWFWSRWGLNFFKMDQCIDLVIAYKEGLIERRLSSVILRTRRHVIECAIRLIDD